jgi:predicted enzyme related to lactoylglutathione lyase
MNVLHLAGLIINSEQPEALARFYRDALGVPFTLQSHGPIRDHYECELAGVHFAILKRKTLAGGAFVPSFACSDLELALADLTAHQVKPLHPIIELGDGKRVCSIADGAGNILRLFQQRPQS